MVAMLRAPGEPAQAVKPHRKEKALALALALALAPLPAWGCPTLWILRVAWLQGALMQPEPQRLPVQS